MRPSPIQLKHIIYEKVFVCPHRAGVVSESNGREFDFDGVKVRASVDAALKQDQQDDPRDFLITLNFGIDNKTGKKAPYDIEVGVIGVFNVLPSLPIEKREDLVTVNGASILYGVIREIVLSLTSRFAEGPLTLPGMNFEDTAPSRQRREDTNRALSQLEEKETKPRRLPGRKKREK